MDNENIIIEGMARRRLAALSGFDAERAERARMTRLAGLTNLVFKVEADGESLCLRLPGQGSETLVERRREENARAAAAVGIAPELIHFADDGTMLTRFVEGVPLTPDHIAASPGALDRAAAALRTLHQGAADFADTFRVFDTLNHYAALIDASRAALTGRQRAVLAEAEPVRKALSLRSPVLRPCHCDPTGRNLIDTGERVWLVDWEYAAMNDPAWDLAYFSVESALDANADRALLAAYFTRPPSETEAARVAVTKFVCEVLAATWALVQHLQGSSATDFRAYAERTFGLAARRLSMREFARHLETLRRG